MKKGAKKRDKEEQIKKFLPDLVEVIGDIVSRNTKIIIISATVYKVCYDEIKKRFKEKVINERSIPFPNSGHQNVFKKLGKSVFNFPSPLMGEGEGGGE